MNENKMINIGQRLREVQLECDQSHPSLGSGDRRGGCSSDPWPAASLHYFRNVVESFTLLLCESLASCRIDTGISRHPPTCIWKNTFPKLAFYGKFKALEKLIAVFIGTSTKQDIYITPPPPSSRNVYRAMHCKYTGLEKCLSS